MGLEKRLGVTMDDVCGGEGPPKVSVSRVRSTAESRRLSKDVLLIR